MCNTKDAQRYEKIAQLDKKDGNNKSARKNYLEAASIHVLQAQLQQNKDLIKDANRCYKLAQEVVGKPIPKDLTLQELAKATIDELDDNHHKDVLSQLKAEV